MAVFCTIFDSFYLDKGLALYESLLKVESDFKLYVFAFDEKSEFVLKELKLSKMIVISLKQFEDEQMLVVKKERSKAEYCWTCTPISVEYVIEHYHEEQCTYIDADLYFYDSPKLLLSELKENKKNILITEHRFSPNFEKNLLKESGKYCVQFNTFDASKSSMDVLKTWKSQTLEWCSYTKYGDKKGDQKYLENWTQDYLNVHELQHLGGGVSWWNIQQYTLTKESNKLYIHFGHQKYPLVFYHFQNIRYLPFGFVNTNMGFRSKDINQWIYYPYLAHLEKIREFLRENYQVQFSIKKGYYKNPILRFIQDYLMPFFIRNWADIINLRNVGVHHDSSQ